jgi:hypothetical protein
MNTPTSGRGFRRWLASMKPERVASIEHALTAFLPQLEAAGFRWTDKMFDGGTAAAQTVNLEREIPGVQMEYVQLNFDKLQRPKFQVIFGAKEFAPPQRWVRGGSLVWKKNNANVKYKWWGTRWWHPDKEGAFRRAIDSAAAHIPQILRYLESAAAGDHVWPDAIIDRKRP